MRQPPRWQRSLHISLIFALMSGSAASVSATQRVGTPESTPQVNQMLARRAALRVERTQLLLEKYSRAEKAARASADQILRTAGEELERSRAPLPLESIAAATRAVEGDLRNTSLEAWCVLADSIDLRVVPGVFAAREEGLGEPMTVNLDGIWKPAAPPEPEGGVDLKLIWIAPDGLETVARSEPASVAALVEGFQAYIRPPVSDAAVWHLVLELRVGPGIIRGRPVPIECVEGLGETRAQLAAVAVEEASPLQRRVLERLRLLRELGLRQASATRLSDWISLTGESPGGLSLEALKYVRLDPEEIVVWEHPLGNGQRAVLLLADAFESPADLLSGPRGRAWGDFAAKHGWRVLAAAPSLPGQAGFQVAQLVQSLREQQGIDELVVVTRGDFGRTLPAHPQSEDLKGIDALVLSETLAARAGLSPDLGLSTLQLVLGAKEELALDEDEGPSTRRTRLYLSVPDPVGVLEVPRRLATWLNQD